MLIFLCSYFFFYLSPSLPLSLQDSHKLCSAVFPPHLTHGRHSILIGMDGWIEKWTNLKRFEASLLFIECLISSHPLNYLAIWKPLKNGGRRKRFKEPESAVFLPHYFRKGRVNSVIFFLYHLPKEGVRRWLGVGWVSNYWGEILVISAMPRGP